MVDVLFVDDTLDNTAIFVTTLSLVGYSVDTCENGVKALEYLNRCVKNGNTLPRLVVSDVNMPQMDGYELCFTIKNTEALSKIPVILYTAVYPKLTQKMALTVTPDDYIIKNISPKKVIEMVDKYLK